MDIIVNKTPLSAENEALFWMIWEWLSARGITKKVRPQVTSEGDFYHTNGLISIDERHDKQVFPLGAAMLEELLHYITTSDNPQTSADFSPAFLHRILEIILGEWSDKSYEEKRDFQTILVGALWKLVAKNTMQQKTSEGA